MKRILFAAAVAGAALVALLSVTAASAKPKPLPVNVACSQQALVDAINAANSAGGGALSLAHKCDYQLTSSPDDSENGLPAITTPISIDGNKAMIDGTNSFRDFEVDGPAGGLFAHDLTITGGSVQDFGGGIANFAGSVTLDHTQVTGNAAGFAGGGIANASITPDFELSSTPALLTVRNSVVSDNQQTVGPPDGGGGGGIFNLDGTASLDHTQVNGNNAQGFVGGGIGSGDPFGLGGNTVLTIDHSQVSDNMAPNAGGGGIQNARGSVTVDHSQVDGNTSLNGGGISSGNQGGSDSSGAELTVEHSQVNGNTATAAPNGEGPPFAAGGIANGADATIDHSQVNGNTASNELGAGIVNHGTMTVSHSEVNHNTAAASGPPGSGGGILNVVGPANPDVQLSIDHSKINDNHADGGYGGGIANGAGSGSKSVQGGALTLTHSEVHHNTAAHGGGIFNNGGTVTLSDTKVTDNIVDNCEPTNTIAGCTN